MITFILFVNFLLRAIDRFLGKGLDILTILEYLFLNLAWILALSVPMAVLLATLMTFGRLSEDKNYALLRLSDSSEQTYLVGRNFETILQYNCANKYAVSVGLLADQLAEI